jgi:hypothetical protein
MLKPRYFFLPLLLVLLLQACQKPVLREDIIGKWEMQVVIPEEQTKKMMHLPAEAFFPATAKMRSEREFFSDGQYNAITLMQVLWQDTTIPQNITVRTEEFGTWNFEDDLIEYTPKSHTVQPLNSDSENVFSEHPELGVDFVNPENPERIVHIKVKRESSGEVILEEVNNQGLDLIFHKMDSPVP